MDQDYESAMQNIFSSFNKAKNAEDLNESKNLMDRFFDVFDPGIVTRIIIHEHYQSRLKYFI